MTRDHSRVFMLCETTLDTHFFRNLCPGLKQSGFEVTYASMREAKAPAWIEESGDEYVWLKANSRIGYLAAVRRMTRIVRDKQIDILHANMHEASLLAAAVKKLVPTVKFVLGRHNTDQLAMMKKPWHVAMDRWATAVADRVVVPSEFTKNYLIEVERADAAKIDAIYIGINTEQFRYSDESRSRVRRELGLESNFVIGCIGKFIWFKGHRFLFEAFAKIVDKIPNARILLLGDGQRALIDKQIADLSLGGKIVFGGYRDDIPECLSALDVVVHPSLTEAFCQVITESMAVERPVIATFVGGAAEAIADGQTGMLVAPRNPSAIASAILELYGDPDKAKQIGKAARNKVMSSFTYARMVQEQVERYARLFSTSGDAALLASNRT